MYLYIHSRGSESWPRAAVTLYYIVLRLRCDKCNSEVSTPMVYLIDFGA